MKFLNKEISSKTFYGTIAAFTGFFMAIDYFDIRHSINNYAMLLIANEQPRMQRDTSICGTVIHAYGYDEDGLSKLEIEVDGRNYITRKLGGGKEYGISFDFCSPQQDTGEHDIKVKATDINGNVENDEGETTVVDGYYTI